MYYVMYSIVMHTNLVALYVATVVCSRVENHKAKNDFFN